jgi:hypothetical protein
MYQKTSPAWQVQGPETDATRAFPEPAIENLRRVSRDRHLAKLLFESVTSRLAADAPPDASGAGKTCRRNDWAEDQEARFERAISELDGPDAA